MCLIGTCLVWVKRSTCTSNSFWVQSHRFNSATSEQIGITLTMMCKPYVFGVTRSGIEPPASCTPSECSNHKATGAANASVYMGPISQRSLCSSALSVPANSQFTLGMNNGYVQIKVGNYPTYSAYEWEARPIWEKYKLNSNQLSFLTTEFA